MKYVAYNVLLTKDPKIINDLFYEEAPLSKTLDDVVRDTNNNTDNATFIIAPNAVNSSNFISLESSFEGEGKSYVSLRLIETKQLLEFFTVAPNSWVEGTLNRMKEESILLPPEAQIMKLSRARSTFYLTFGVGSDIKTWSGPFAINIADAKLSMSQDGVRELEVMFTPTVDSIKVFTNRILNDISYRSKDSPFSTIEAQSNPEKSACTGSIVLDIVKRTVDARKLKSTTTETVAEVVADSPEFPEVPWYVPGLGIGSMFARKVQKQAKKIANNKKRQEAPVEIQELSTPYGQSRYSQREFNGKTNPFRDKREANISLWNYAVRALIIDYLQTLFQTVPKGNILVLFDDDLDEKRESEPLIIEPSFANKTFKGITSKRNLITRCERNLAKMGIQISLSKKNNSEGQTTREETASRVTENITGEESNIESGDASISIDRASTSNSDRYSEAQVRPKSRVVLTMSTVVDDQNSESPVLLHPLVTFQRRLTEIFPEKPSDFTVYEETDLNIIKLMHDNGLVENVKEPVVVFGRKSVIFQTLYNFNPSVDLQLIHNMSPYNAREATLEKVASTAEDAWENYRKQFIEFFAKNSKLRVSSFREKLNVSKTTTTGGGGSQTYINGILDNNPEDPINLIFAHNVTNGNVLSLNFDSKPYVGVLMGYANRPVYRLIDEFTKYSNYQIERDTSFNFPFVNYIADKIKEIKQTREYQNNPKQSFQKLFEKLTSGEEATETMTLLMDDQVAQGMSESSFFDLLLLKLSANAEGKFTVERRVPQKAMGKKEADLLQSINKSIINVNIRTLPFFNSNIRIGARVLLYGKSNYVVGSRIASEDNSLAIYSNFYSIVGFRHYMDKSDAYSQFTLVQDGYQEGSTSDRTIGERFKEQLKKAKEKIATEARQQQVEEAVSENFTGGTTEDGTRVERTGLGTLVGIAMPVNDYFARQKVPQWMIDWGLFRVVDEE